ncbi:MAG: nuclear transport factor 2 family protein [Dehalococcoidia bacterium]
MGEHASATLARRAVEAFNKQDMATLTEVFHERIKWHTPGKSQVAGVKDGHDALFAWFQKLGEMTNGTFRPDGFAFYGDDDHAVMLVHLTGERARRNWTATRHWFSRCRTASWATPISTFTTSTPGTNSGHRKSREEKQ